MGAGRRAVNGLRPNHLGSSEFRDRYARARRNTSEPDSNYGVLLKWDTRSERPANRPLAHFRHIRSEPTPASGKHSAF